MSNDNVLNVLIASYLEPEHVERIQAVSPNLNVLYYPELLPQPRYTSDHVGKPLVRSAEDEKRWKDLLAETDIQFAFDATHMSDLPELTPRLRWLQATSAGIGQAIVRLGYDVRMPDVIFTTASGVHSRPLAEFVVMSVIMHYKKAKRLEEGQRNKHWERYAGSDLEGRTAGVLGLGNNGGQVARTLRLLGMRVFGSDLMKRESDVDRYFPADEWKEMLPHLDVLVLALPHTPHTANIVDAEAMKLLPEGAFLVNIARGTLVDEQAMISLLQNGRLGGAALDVFEQEPLPQDNPLWEMPNVLVSPHSASTSDRENERIVDLFCDNLERFLAGKPLRNVLDTERMY
jgi:glyoxylate/hydroxypyruvate reductase